jgi:copper chaperone
MSTTAYTVRGMTCSHCVAAVTKELEALPGVESVDVRLDGGVVTVAGDVSEESVAHAVADAGYELVGQL